MAKQYRFKVPGTAYITVSGVGRVHEPIPEAMYNRLIALQPAIAFKLVEEEVPEETKAATTKPTRNGKETD